MDLISYNVEDYYEPSSESIVKGHLRFELGWTEVRRGLGLMLRGYFTLIGASVILGVVVGVLVSMSPQERAKIPWQIRETGFFLGLGLFGLLCTYCYGCVVVGTWRCLLNAPERRGARWLMFGCITCILAGPALNLASGITGVENKPKLEKGLDGIREFKMSKEGAIMQLGSGALQVLGGVLFILFLRAVVGCFDDRFKVFLLDLYLILSLALVAGTVWIFLQARDLETLFQRAAIIGLGWVLNFAGYLAAIMITRGSITRGLAKVVSPLKEVNPRTGLTGGSVLPLN
jgi:hypothetical protein